MNILREPVIGVSGVERRALSLPQVFAALTADEIDAFPALRPHQAAAWHMFLVQLAVLAMDEAGISTLPDTPDAWERAVSSLTRDTFPDDEPWCLVVDDPSKPAFMQPPVPEGESLKTFVSTPDALDMVITSKNHDLKQAVAEHGDADDWIFALVSLQTMEGFGGRGNYGVARMNGGSSSRVCLSLLPLRPENRHEMQVRPGQLFRRNVTQLLARKSEFLSAISDIYANARGHALLWTLDWPACTPQLSLAELHPLFIEVCRRVRLSADADHIVAHTGNSDAARVDAANFNGAIGDPWAPVHIAEGKSLTLGENGRFTYRRIVELTLSGDWNLPLLASLGDDEAHESDDWLLLADAFARGNSKTGGYESRRVPITGRAVRILGLGRSKAAIHEVANAQADEIAKIDVILRNAIALHAAEGVFENINEAAYAATRAPRDRLAHHADRIFFPYLWERFDAKEAGDTEAVLAIRERFVRDLVAFAEHLLPEALAAIPIRSAYRHRAETRALRHFHFLLRRSTDKGGFAEIFAADPVVAQNEVTTHD